MNYDLSESIPQGSDRAQETENRRIAEIADKPNRICRVYEAQPRPGQNNVNLFSSTRSSGPCTPYEIIIANKFDTLVKIKSLVPFQERGFFSLNHLPFYRAGRTARTERP